MELTFDEFKEKLPTVTDPREKIRFIQEFLWTAYDLIPDQVAFYAEEAFELAKKTNDRNGMAYGHMNKAFFGLVGQHDPKAEDNFKLALDIFQEVGDQEGESRAMNMIAYGLWWRGKYDEALQYAFGSMKLAEEVRTPDSLGWSNYALGVFHYDLKDYPASEIYYKKALDHFKDGRTKTFSQSRCRSGLGSVMIATGRLDEALEYISVSVEGYRKLQNRIGEARALNDLGMIFKSQGKYREAETELKKSLELREASKYHQGIITTCFELGGLYLKEKDHTQAMEYLNKALLIAEETNTKPKIFQIHGTLGELYKETKDLEKALFHKEKFFEVKDEVTGEQATNKLKNLQTQFATEKSEKEAEIHRLKNVELKKAYAEIEEKNKSIVDSINYAKRIQQAILPSEEEIRHLLPQSFILYKPKDVVSGDFYWVAEKKDKVFFAAVDCTGHGVPGAFMSMIGHTLLNEIVNDKDISAPDEILFQLREGIIKSLKQTGAEGENKDGMDIALCCLEGNILHYAGANNPLWVISSRQLAVGSRQLTEIKGDKQPIGIYTGDPKPFTSHKLELSKGDQVYIFTDGYADQFGGPKGKKFKYKQLQEIIIANAALPMEKQGAVLDKTIEEWRGKLEQVDDVLVIGYRR